MRATFTEGSIFRHICAMTLASAMGLLLLFFVDVLDMFWLSLLGEVQLAAALGYAGSILFFTLSVGIGLSIACSAVVSQSIGKGDEEQTQKLVGSVLLITFLLTLPILVVVLAATSPVLSWLGAGDKSFTFARNYMWIVLPSMPLMTLSMACTGVLRAFGHAKEAMYVTLIAGVVNAVLDPLFIFGVGWGIEGAAVATALSRVAMLAYALWQIILVKRYFVLPELGEIRRNVTAFFQVAVPAMLTNLSTPVSFAYVTSVMADFGDSAVAGNTVLVKIQPLAFAGLFALSGAIGPIVGQNFGAAKPARIMETLKKSLLFIVIYCVVACGSLFFLSELIVQMFKAQNDAAEIIRWFCLGISTIFLFNGITFCTNSIFNNLEVAHWATYINLAKATLFTIPFVYFGAELGGPVGVWLGMYLGSVIVAVFGLLLAYNKIRWVWRASKVAPL